jgi:hypothetical protein
LRGRISRIFLKEKGSYILPQIHKDEFSRVIKQILSEFTITNLLEIGSSSGEGSTSTIVNSLNKNYFNLYLLEIDPLRNKLLKLRYKKNSMVKVLPYSSISLSEYPADYEIIKFYNENQTNLNRYDISLVLKWLKDEKIFLKSLKVSDICGIDFIKHEFGIEFFDFVLIDGSEFTGYVEFQHIIGAKFILLDDVNAFKSNKAYNQLLMNSSYKLYYENLQLRNGSAIFQKIS